MDWKILGIEETTDKKAIKDAYRERLSVINPEDKPEEFKALRNAYEEALRLADVTSVPDSEKTEFDLWEDKLKALYDKFEDRINVNAWKKLFSEDICVSLDTRYVIEEILLKFLMGNFFLPQEIWIYLESQFSFSSRKEELYEKYPRDFIDYCIIDRTNYKERLPMELYIPGKDGNVCEEYSNTYNEILSTDMAAASELVDKLRGLNETHPYGEIYLIRYDIANGQDDRIDDFKELTKKYPGNVFIALNYANDIIKLGRYEEAADIINNLLEANDKLIDAHTLLAKIYYEQNQYEDAVDELNVCMGIAGGNKHLLYELNQKRTEYNLKYIEELLEKINANPEDSDSVLCLAWCYHQNDEYDTARQYFEKLSPETVRKYSYYNLASSLALCGGQYEEAVGYFDKVLEALKEIKPDGTKKTERRIARYPEYIARKASSLQLMERYEEAIEQYELALTLDPDNTGILTNVCGLCLDTFDYEKAIYYCQRIIEAAPNESYGYFLLASAYTLDHQDGFAYDAVCKAIDRNPADLMSYLLKIKLFINNGNYSEAREDIAFLKENGVEDCYELEFYEAMLVYKADNKPEEAKVLFDAINDKLTAEDDKFYFAGDFYLEYALLTSEITPEKELKTSTLIELLDKGLSNNKRHTECMDYKAWLLKRDNRLEESLELYKELEKRPHSLNVEREIAEIYYSNVSKTAKQALHYYKILLEKEPGPFYMFYVGMCYRYLRQYSMAIPYFEELKKLEPDGIDGSYRLSEIYLEQGIYDKALEEIDLVIEKIDVNSDEEADRYYELKVRVLRRLRQPEEAVKLLKYMADTFTKYSAYYKKLIEEVYAQFALFDDLYSYMENRYDFISDREANERYIKYQIMQNHPDAGINLEKLKDKLTTLEYLAHKVDYEMINGNFDEALKLFQQWMKLALKNKDTKVNRFHYKRIARLYALCGNKEEAFNNGKKAVDIFNDSNLRRFGNEKIHYTFLCSAYIYMGDKEKAREYLELSRKYPLCTTCDYDICKDAVSSESFYEYFFGSKDKAYELAVHGIEAWPDEIDFRCIKAAIEKER